MSYLNIYFKDSEFITVKRYKLQGMLEFLADCGGLLGLFMGVSMLSIVEILYFIFLRMCSLRTKKKRQRRAHEV